jgi:hypothetical protein
MASYYRRFVIQVYKQMRGFGREQFVGLILAIFILLAQLHYGLITKESLHRNELAVIAPYIVILGLYLALQIIRAPVALDQEKSRTIQGLAGPQVDPDAIIAAVDEIRASIDAGHKLFGPDFRREDHDRWRQQTTEMLRTLFGHPAVKSFDDADPPETRVGTLDEIARESTRRQIKVLTEIADSVRKGEIRPLR